jgi:hypothetical protein
MLRQGTSRFALVAGLLTALFSTEVSAQLVPMPPAEPTQKQTPASAGPPEIVVERVDMRLAARACILRAEEALRKLGFDDIRRPKEGDTAIDRFVFADRGDFAASVNCLEKRLVYIVVAGPNGEDNERECARLAKAIADRY